MKWICNLFLIGSMLAAFACSSKSAEHRDTAIFTIFHSNDITGYLTPCG